VSNDKRQSFNRKSHNAHVNETTKTNVHLRICLHGGAGIDQQPNALGVSVLNGTQQRHVSPGLPARNAREKMHRKQEIKCLEAVYARE
jgi:hypothetical protein